MSKKIIRLTESDLTNIVKRVISEQSEERIFNAAIQQFLNNKLKAGLDVDGKTGRNSKTEAAIAKYQSMIGTYPADGVWGPQTWDKMPEKDKKMLKDTMAKLGGPVDRFINWLSGLF